MQHRQQGFTLIELVVVIVILGILAATALPRLVGLSTDARIAKLNAARGAVLAAAGMVNAAAQARTGIVQPSCPATGTVPNVTATGGGTICSAEGTITVVNWNPTANAAGIIAAAGLSGLAADGYSITGGGGGIGSTLTIRVNGGPTVANCSFTYRPSAPNGAAGTSATVSAVTVTGC